MTDESLSARDELAQLLRQPDPKIDLAHAALVIARDEYPLLPLQRYLSRLATLANRVAERLPEDGDPVGAISAMNGVLFDEEGFRGNDDDYYDPRNSFLNEVLDRRVGIPITLSLVYMAVGRRADLPMAGIGLPGHFITAFKTKGKPIYVDPFHQGRIMTEQDCAKRVSKIFGGKMSLTPEHLNPMTSRALLFRLLTNLKNIYIESRSYAKAHAVVDKMVLLTPDDWTQVRDRGLVRYHLKHYQPALADLELYLQNVPLCKDRADILKLAKTIIQELNDNR